MIRNHNDVVTTFIHDQQVLVNCGYSYPITTRTVPTYNQPLIELVHQAAKSLHRPIYFVDVGAAVGDTILLVSSNCRENVEHYFAVDGDKEFFDYLTHNLSGRNDCTLFNALLSSDEGSMQSLIRTHQGTASAQGTGEVQSTTLDKLLQDAISQSKVDVIKIDIDGFDGRALSGAREALKIASAVIFEWHPILYQQTGNSWLEPFRILTECEFTNLVWFSKFGNFNQFTNVPDRESLDKMAEYCLADIGDDWHWDIVALKSDTDISMIDLARMRFAQNRTSRW